MKSRGMLCALVTVGALLAATRFASAQTEVNDGETETTSDSTSPKGEEQPAALSIEYPESTKKKKKKPEPATQQQGPAAVSVEYVDRREPEPAETGVYSKKVQGKLWLEAFVGPSSYDPDRFGGGEVLGGRLDAPKETGPEFGAAIGGAAFDGAYFIGGSYRQANYSNYNLLKAGLAQQVTITMAPYVHPVVRIDLGYAHVFGGRIYPSSMFPVDDSPRHGFYFTLGVGVRVPIIRWISFLATFDWTGAALFGESTVTSGQQLGGTFALTFHFIDVDGD